MKDPLKDKEVIISFRQFGQLNSRRNSDDKKYASCRESLHLRSAFVNYSISKEGAPRFYKSPFMHKKWPKMSSIKRLQFHVNEIVSDLGGRNFSMKLL